MARNKKNERIVPDTSVIVNGQVSKLIETGEIGGEVIILEAVLSELENQANKKRPIGFEGLEELSKLKELEKKGKIKLTFYGKLPTPEEIKAARFGAIDALIRDVATKLDATLLTSDYVQYLAARARGIKCEHIEVKPKEKLSIENFFDGETMSVHLKLDVPPMAKKGKPGKVRLVKLSEKPTTEKELRDYVKEIINYGRKNQSIEISMKGATVVQIGNYRIAIAEPPFSDATEITIVRPIAKVTLDDYKLSEKLMSRLRKKAEGVFICGPPGAGKSSFAAALAEFYREEKNAIVKTMESPRDLQVGKEITQYSPLEGSMTKTADVLLLVRPDFTVYDEVRKTNDFQVFADMRLAGVGMIGVTHASSPLDALQRLVSRMELGQIPLIVDTVIFIKDAEIRKVYETKMTVKVPAGMMEADLARPVVEVRDFETGKIEYEIYTFGEETVIMPLKEAPEEVIPEISESKTEFILNFGERAQKKNITAYAGRNFLFKTKLGKSTEIRLRKKSKMGKAITRAIKYGDKIRGVLS